MEDVEAARREAGDVAIAVEKGALAWEDVATMAEVVRGDVALDPARRVVFKTVGMPWEDLAEARVVAGGRGSCVWGRRQLQPQRLKGMKWH